LAWTSWSFFTLRVGSAGLRDRQIDKFLGQLLKKTLMVGQRPALQLVERRGGRSAGLDTELASLHAGDGVDLLENFPAVLFRFHALYLYYKYKVSLKYLHIRQLKGQNFSSAARTEGCRTKSLPSLAVLRQLLAKVYDIVPRTGQIGGFPAVSECLGRSLRL
jgi:hypothetical protein